MTASPDSFTAPDIHLATETLTEQLRARVQAKLRKLQAHGVGGNAPVYLLEKSHTAGSVKLMKIEQAADASLARVETD